MRIEKLKNYLAGISKIFFFLPFLIILISPAIFSQRYMENLGRGTVAVRDGSSRVFVSWRILGLEFNNGVTYNLYRDNTRIASNLRVSNYMDNTRNNSAYSVAAVVNGAEQNRSPAVNVNTYVHGGNSFACMRVPIRYVNGYTPFLIYVGDLDGDGEFDFVFDLHPDDASRTILLQAVKQDGTFLWQLDCGPNSVNKNNIEPGSSVFGVGHGDNYTVYDINNDGKAEVIARTANGVRFGDGSTLSGGDDRRQYISILEGTTGRELARAPVGTDFINDGPMSGHMGIAYLDGVNPSVVWSCKNRMNSGQFNMMVSAWTLKNGSLTQNWKFLRPGIGGGNFPDGHNIRCGDFDGDGRDEVSPFGFVIDDDGSILYSLGDQGVVHGDRFHIGDLDPNHPGLEGYGIQQENRSGLAWYYYDARTGSILQKQIGNPSTDYARALAGDLDPRYPGYEFHTFTDGLYNVSGRRITTSMPDSYPNLRIWWDGDLLSENLDNNKMTKWDYIANINDSEIRLFVFRNNIQAGRNTPGFYGDILGDWREEVVYAADDRRSLLVFTTLTPTDTALYTLAHEPLYRNCLTTKGYYQSNMIGYYLGDGMSSPPAPNIRYVGGATPEPTVTPVPTPTPKPINPGTTVRLEAEEGNAYDALIENQHAGFSGSGYVNFNNQPGGYVEWTVILASANSASCSFVYANGGSTGRPADISVNGNVVSRGVDFPSTSDWASWSQVARTLNLNAGSNTIRLTGTGADGGANIDRVDIAVESNTSPTANPVSRGDANGDGEVDIVDALLMAQYYVGLITIIDISAADADCSGEVDIVDALLTAQYYVGLINSLEC